MSYIKQFRPLTSEDVEIIRRKQGGIKNIYVMLEKEPPTQPVFEKNRIKLVVEIMPQLNTSVRGYYILHEILCAKDGLPQLMTKEVYDAHIDNEYICDAYMDATKIETNTDKSIDMLDFNKWLVDNFNLSLFGRFKFKDEFYANGDRGSWAKDELYEIWNKHEYAYYMSQKVNPVLVLRPVNNDEPQVAKIETDTGKIIDMPINLPDFSKFPPLENIQINVLADEDTILGTVKVNFSAIEKIKEEFGLNVTKLISEQLFYEIEKLVTLRTMKKVEKEIFIERKKNGVQG